MSRIIYYVLFLYLLSPIWATGNTGMSKLKTRMHFLNKNIEAFDQLLNKNKKEQDQLIRRAEILNTQIDQRAELINLTEKELKHLDEVIESKGLEIEELECLLSIHLERYNSILLNHYRNRFSFNPTYYISSSKGFWKAYHRWQYVQLFKSILKDKNDHIEASRIELVVMRKALKEELLEKERLVEDHSCQKQLMAGELEESRVLITQLEKSKQHFNKKLRQNQGNQALLERYFPKGQAISVKQSSEDELQAQTMTFSKRKGKLGWPVKQVRLAKKHGHMIDRKFPDVSYFHNGIDIRTNSDAVVSIAPGEVVDVFEVGGNKTTVLLQHGNYYSVYGNLSVAGISPGDAIQAGDKIGNLERKPGNKTNKLHFELWLNKEMLDPEVWLK